MTQKVICVDANFVVFLVQAKWVGEIKCKTGVSKILRSIFVTRYLSNETIF